MSAPFSKEDVQALLSFLSDPSERTQALVKARLLEALRAKPELRALLDAPPDPSLIAPAGRLLDELCWEESQETFRTLASQGEFLDLELGALTLASLAYPRLQRRAITEPLDRMAQMLRARIEADEIESEDDVLALLRRYLFEELRFHGNEKDYYDPDNSYINRVLERRTGIPISLACVYLLLGWRLDLPVFGIGLPGHFIVGHQTEKQAGYLDPFYGGRTLSKPECIELVRQRGLKFQESFLDPTPPRQILSRMMVNLLNIYTEQGETERAQRLSQGLQILQGSGA